LADLPNRFWWIIPRCPTSWKSRASNWSIANRNDIFNPQVQKKLS
jgi:hypothetical protein